MPHEVSVPSKKQNFFRLERTDLIFYTVCDSSAQISPWRRNVLGEDCLFGPEVSEKVVFKTSDKEDPDS